MKFQLSALFFLALIANVVGQQWTGTFQVQGSCNSNLCCCYSGILTSSRTSSGYLSLYSDGVGCTSSYSSSTFTYPTSYSFSYNTTSGQTITYSISYDGRTMSFSNNPYSYCSDTAVRTDSSASVMVKSSLNLFWMIFATIVMLKLQKL